MKDYDVGRLCTVYSYRSQNVSNRYNDICENYKKNSKTFEDVNNLKVNYLIRNIIPKKAVSIKSTKITQTNSHLKELCRDLKNSLNIHDNEVVPKKGNI